MVGRDAIQRHLVDHWLAWKPGQDRRHSLLIGPRGIGKSSLLVVLAHRVRTETELSRRWAVVRFPEDSHDLTSVAEVLLQSLQHLGKDYHDHELSAAFTRLREEMDDERLIDRARDVLAEFGRTRGIGVLLILENLQRVMGRQFGATDPLRLREMQRLRRILHEDNHLTLLGSAPTYFHELSDRDQPFFDFFDVHVLGELSPGDQDELILRLAEQRGVDEVKSQWAQFQARLRAIHHFTGGNPRLIHILFELFVRRGLTEVQAQLEALLDQVTPYYQERLNDLAPQEARVLTSLSIAEENLAPADLAREMRLPVANVTQALTRLKVAGYVKAYDRAAKRTLYYIPERFFRIWQQWSHSRHAKKRLRHLVSFFATWYGTADERNREWASLEHEIASGTSSLSVNEEPSQYLDYLVASALDTKPLESPVQDLPAEYSPDLELLGVWRSGSRDEIDALVQNRQPGDLDPDLGHSLRLCGWALEVIEKGEGVMRRLREEEQDAVRLLVEARRERDARDGIAGPGVNERIEGGG